MLPVPTESWAFVQIKAAGWSQQLEVAPVNELSENPSSSSLGGRSGFRRMGSATAGKRDRVGWPPLSRSESRKSPGTNGDPQREGRGLGSRRAGQLMEPGFQK